MRRVGMLAALLALGAASAALGADFLDITADLPYRVIARSDGAASRSGIGGVQFTVQSTGGATPLRGVAYLSGFFVAVGDGGRVVRSSDGGLNWGPVDASTTADLYDVSMHAGTYLIAVGASGTTLRLVGTAAVFDTTASPGGATLRGVATSGTILVAVGDGGTVLRSTDQGLSWQRQTLAGTPDLRAVECTNTTFVAVGLGGRIVRSTDSGLNWGELASPTSADLLGIATDGSTRLVAVGAGGTVLRVLSPTGAGSWEQASFPLAITLRNVAWDGSYFYAVGDAETVARSTDGTTWFQVAVDPTSWSRVKSLYGGPASR